MRYFICLITVICFFKANGQITLTTNIGLAETYCTDPSNPNNCFNVPAGNDMLTYFPGIDGDYVVTYKIENNTATTITQVSISDTKHGQVLPLKAVNIPTGTSLFLTERFDSTTTPGFNEITATLIAQNAAGASSSKTSDYILDIVAPEADIEVGVLISGEFCNEEDDLASCPVMSTSTFGDTIRTGGGELLYIECRLFNVGVATIKRHTWEDNVFGVQHDYELATAREGSDLRFREILTAPTVPGLYEILMEYTGEDAAGNILNKNYTYYIEVVPPQADIEVGVLLSGEFCDEEDNLASCPTMSTSTFGDTIRTGGGELLYIECRLFNVGTTAIKRHTWEDDLFGIQHDYEPATAREGNDLRFREILTAPTVPGLYEILMEYTGEDAAGNILNKNYTYYIEVVPPQADIEVGVLLSGEFCDEEDNLASCPLMSTSTFGDTIRTGGGELLYIECRLFNVGTTTIKRHTWEDNLFGIIHDYTPATANERSDLRFRDILEAPSAPGIYEILMEYTGEDEVGNILEKDFTYFIEVLAPNALISVGLGIGSDYCTDSTDLTTCGLLPTNLFGDTLFIGAGEQMYQEFRLQNIEDVDLKRHTWLDTYYGLLHDNTPATAANRSDLRFRKLLMSPDADGVYTNEVTYTGLDAVDNMVVKQANYTISVDCNLGDKAPPLAICKDTTIIIGPGTTVNLSPGKLNGGSIDGCGPIVGGSLDKSSFTCADVGENVVTLTVEDASGNTSTCTSIVTIKLTSSFTFTAGPDQEICTVQTQLDADVPSGGMKMWTIESGTGGMIGQAANPTSMFAGVRGETYVLRWTQSNGTCVFSDDVIITILDFPTTADAGVDQVLCSTDSTNLDGSNQLIGQGQWTILSGANGKIENDELYDSKFEGERATTYELEWKISNGGCAVSRDTVVIEILEFPSDADAGEDQSICTTLTNISAITPAIGTGSWTVVEGAGGSFLNSNIPNTGFAGTKGETYKIEWAVTNGTCEVSRDTIQIAILDDPSAAVAGDDQVVSDDNTTLAAIVPTTGVGSWDFVSGIGGSIADINSATSDFSGLLGETYQLEWTVSNGSCSATRDTVSITLQALPPSTASAGDDKVSCNATVMLDASTPIIGSGIWTIVDGMGGSFTSTSSPSSSFSGVVGETYILQWRIENDGLFSSDQVMIRIADTNEVIDDNYVLDWAGADIISGSDTITVEAMLDAGFDKTLEAGSVVEFLPGTELEAGAQLEILIEACNN